MRTTNAAAAVIAAAALLTGCAPTRQDVANNVAAIEVRGICTDMGFRPDKVAAHTSGGMLWTSIGRGKAADFAFRANMDVPHDERAQWKEFFDALNTAAEIERRNDDTMDPTAQLSSEDAATVDRLEPIADAGCRKAFSAAG